MTDNHTSHTHAQEYLSFILNEEQYGIDILSVQEIRGWSTVTDIPNTPPYLKGVINLRGIIVPIVDLRERFNYEPLEYGVTTVVIILKNQHKESNTVGIVVDAVADVHEVEAANIKDAPNLGKRIDSRFIKCMATLEEKIIILLDSAVLLNVDELFSNIGDLQIAS